MRGFIITKYYWSGQNKKHESGEESSTYAKCIWVLVRKPEGKRQLERP